ncbi:hypothetical protein HID58_094293 [Brassica napus]|uniref:ADP-ribosyl cyclase/cyclic ADP-ribose hydrolase n=1 Tax=Brassica napus TaxID=3708 RepID=A0ABQ7XA96_BRANA|nr:hypothetical protein HID58_094293 [Brassica napus]
MFTRAFAPQMDNESAMIQNIATYVSNTLSRGFDGMVGLKTHLEKLESLLSLECSDVKMIGIWGPAGIGKTTIARALFNKFSTRFPFKCFMGNLEGDNKNDGVDGYDLKLRLQNQLLSKILNQKDLRVRHLGAIKEWLQDQKVFIILDGVYDLAELEALAKDVSWFGYGSRIIVTTEDKYILRAHGISDIYYVDFPSEKEAIEILCLSAFRQSFAIDGFEELASRAANLCGNLPLGLSVVGSSLRLKSKHEWELQLCWMKASLDKKIENVLRMGYDRLMRKDQSLFIQIACFFNNEAVDYVTTMLANKNLDVRSGLKTLADKSLVQISTNGRIVMHALLQQLGRQLVLKQFKHSETKFLDEITKETMRMLNRVSPCKTQDFPGIEPRSKELEELLMFDNDRCVRTIGVLGMAGIGKTLVADIDKELEWYQLCHLRENLLCKLLDVASLDERAYSWENYLRNKKLFIVLDNVTDKKQIDVLIGEKSLYRQGTRIVIITRDKKLLQNQADATYVVPRLNDREAMELFCLKAFPGNLFPPEEFMDLSYSFVDYSKGHPLALTALTDCVRGIFLNMSNVETIKLSPAAFKRMSSLKFLKFHNSHCSRWCDNDHKFQFCEGLEHFPDALVYLHWQGYPYDHLPSDFNPEELVYLNLRYSYIKELWKEEQRLRYLPNDFYNLKSLQELILSGCSALQSLPSIKEKMDCLEILLMDGTSIKQTPETNFFRNLKKFSFCGSSIEDSTGLVLLPFSGSSSVSDLYLTNCNINKLPDSFSSLHSLRCLCLSRNDIETLPESIEKLHCLLVLDLKHCRRLNSLPVLPSNLQYVDAHGCVSLEKVAKPVTLPLGLVLDPLVSICFPGSEIPSWFCHQRMGSSIETDLLPHWCNSKFIGASLCVVVSFKDYEGQHANRLSVRCKCSFKNQNGQSTSFSFSLGGWNESCGSSSHETRKLEADHVFISYNTCNVPVFKWSEESNNRCHSTSASFEFYIKDETERKLEGFKVMRCGMSLLYAPDENDRGFQGIRVTDIVEYTSSKAFVPVQGRSHSQVEERRRNGTIRDEIPL